MLSRVKTISKRIIPTLRQQGVIKAALFGSVVRGDAKNKSDVDILVKFNQRKSLLDLVRLQFMLEDKLKKKVDLLTYDSIHPMLRESIINDQEIFYEKRP